MGSSGGVAASHVVLTPTENEMVRSKQRRSTQSQTGQLTTRPKITIEWCPICNHVWGSNELFCHCQEGACHNRPACTSQYHIAFSWPREVL